MLDWRASTSDASSRSLRGPVSLSRKGPAAATTTNSRPGAEMPWFAERDIFQNLVHSHTKASLEAGLRTHRDVDSWIVDKNPSRWGGSLGDGSRNSTAQNLERFWCWWGGGLCVGGGGRQIGVDPLVPLKSRTSKTRWPKLQRRWREWISHAVVQLWFVKVDAQDHRTGHCVVWSARKRFVL